MSKRVTNEFLTVLVEPHLKVVVYESEEANGSIDSTFQFFRKNGESWLAVEDFYRTEWSAVSSLLRSVLSVI